jgi:DNA polymerase I-like protein with 3'-5' exonuclease and polymerase domains
MNKYVVMLVESKWHSLRLDDQSEYREESNFNFLDTDTLISFQTSDLTREIRSKNLKTIPNIIDLESLEKQISQRGSSDQDSKNWKVLNILREHNIIDEEFKLKKETFELFLNHIATLYNSLIDLNENENERFEKIEQKINRLLYERQIEGIRYSKNIAINKSKELEREVFKIKNILQLEYNMFMPENEKQQREYLVSKNYTIIRSIQYSLKINRHKDKVCELLYNLVRNQKDLDSLLFILSYWGSTERTFPTYIGFGTITSRITMRQPSIQNMRKENRSIVIADHLKKLLYIDYSQFEAGILASLSEDEELIKLYNNDIYKDLARYVFSNEEKRSEAKIIFYRYMYGDKTLRGKAKSYFKNFPKLVSFKKAIDEEVRLKRIVGTPLGNFRQSFDNKCTWGLSHKIQATASLIFKNSLVRVYEEVKDAEFLIPMHDAALYQISELQYEDCKEKMIKIFEEEFSRFCPEIKPRVNCESFYKEPQAQTSMV